MSGTPVIGSNLCELGGGDYIKRAVPAATTYVVGFRYKTDSLPTTNQCLLGFYGTSYGQCYLNLTPNAAFTVTRPTTNTDQVGAAQTGTVIGASATGCIAETIYSYLEVWCKLDNTVGEFEVRVNGVPVLETADLTSRDTSYSETTIGAIAIGAPGATKTATIKDLYILDTTGSVNNTFLGDVTVEPLFPQTDAVAAGTHEDFTCLTGLDQGAMVDDKPPDLAYPDRIRPTSTRPRSGINRPSTIRR